MPKGYGNMRVGEIDPANGWCHPAQAKRTKCACGATVQMRAVSVRCDCGRRHVRAPGAAFASTGAQPVRPGGKAGCPGVREGK